MQTTDVLFRKEKEGTILAVFPYDISTLEGSITCYAHLGQHSSMTWDYLRSTKPVKDKREYADLYAELKSIGYDLRVIQKRNYNKYLNELYKVRNEQ